MKKLLIATTALVAGATAAAADVSISGYSRFGLQYVEDRANIGGAEAADTIISSRLRLTINATTETDVGVTFGAKLRLQYDDGDTQTAGNAAQFSVAYEGLKVQVGNVDTAWDSVGLTYDSEMGYEDSSFGDSINPFYAYNSKSQSTGYQGVAATYSVSDVNLYFSYVNPDQRVKDLDVAYGNDWDKEIGLGADWTNGQISLAAAINLSSGGYNNLDTYFIGGAYNFGDGNVGLNYYYYDDKDGYYAADTGTGVVGTSYDLSQVTVYGNYTFGATTVRAYVSDVDASGADTAYGLGADYSLGEGARVSGSIQSGFAGETVADLGVRFDF